MEQMIIGDPKRTVFHAPDAPAKAKRANRKGTLTKIQERAADELAAQWKADFEARVQARLKRR